MKRGVSGFVGGRLRIARELRGIDRASSLADLIDVSRQVVSQYELGQARPTPEQLERIARALNVPVGFFLKPLPRLERGVPFFRSMKAAHVGDRARAGALLVVLSDVTEHLLEFVELPPPDLPRPALPGGFRMWSDEQIEVAAQDVRRAMGVRGGPLPNLVLLMEHRGVMIGRDYLAERELDGLSDWIGDRPYVLLNTTKSPARSRLDLSHELGHLTMHRSVDEATLADPRSFDLLERQAYRFARALLLPASEFAYQVVSGSLDELVAMKSRWQVSVGAMIYRIGDLGLLSKEAVTALWRKHRRAGWHVAEPLEDAVRLERPTLLKSSAELVRDEAGIPATDIIDQSMIPTSDFLRLSGLADDFLDSSLPANVVRLQARSGW